MGGRCMVLYVFMEFWNPPLHLLGFCRLLMEESTFLPQEAAKAGKDQSANYRMSDFDTQVDQGQLKGQYTTSSNAQWCCPHIHTLCILHREQAKCPSCGSTPWAFLERHHQRGRHTKHDSNWNQRCECISHIGGWYYPWKTLRGSTWPTPLLVSCSPHTQPHIIILVYGPPEKSVATNAITPRTERIQQKRNPHRRSLHSNLLCRFFE